MGQSVALKLQSLLDLLYLEHILDTFGHFIDESPHDKTNKIACAPSEDSDQPEHPPSLIRVVTIRMKKALVLSYPLRAQWKLWSDWADVQADLSLRWAHSDFGGFVMRRLRYNKSRCIQKIKADQTRKRKNITFRLLQNIRKGGTSTHEYLGECTLNLGCILPLNFHRRQC